MLVRVVVKQPRFRFSVRVRLKTILCVSYAVIMLCVIMYLNTDTKKNKNNY
jgi:hypothetical protein